MYIFIAIILLVAVIVNNNNARYILAGYNTLSEYDRKRFNLNKYLKFFKTYLFSLACIYLILGLIIKSISNEIVFIVFALLFPIVGFFLLIYKSLSFYSANRKNKYLVLLIGTVIIAFFIVAVGLGLKKPNINIGDQQIHISGSFGEDIDYKDIVDISRGGVPSGTRKIKGFQLQDLRKGIFELPNKEVVTILANQGDKCLIISTKTKEIFLDYDPNIEKEVQRKLIKN